MRVPLDYEPGTFHPLSQIPDLLRHIVQFVAPETLIASVQVANKQFQALANENDIWKRLCIQEGYDERLNELDYCSNDDDSWDWRKEEKEGSQGFFKKLYMSLRIRDETEEDEDRDEFEDETTYFAEKAKSGRSRCRRCGSKIDDKELRLGITSRTEEYHTNTHYYHWKCGIKSIIGKIEHPHEINGYEYVGGKDRKLLTNLLEEKEEEKRRKREEMFPPSLQAYTCDNCLKLCVGVVYHCQDCRDSFHLCDTCYEKSEDEPTIHDPSHYFDSDNNLLSLSCDLCDQQISEALFHCKHCECFDLCQSCAILAQKGEISNEKHDMTHPFIYVGRSEEIEALNVHCHEVSNKRKYDDYQNREEPAAKRRKVISLRGLLSSYGLK